MITLKSIAIRKCATKKELSLRTRFGWRTFVSGLLNNNTNIYIDKMRLYAFPRASVSHGISNDILHVHPNRISVYGRCRHGTFSVFFSKLLWNQKKLWGSQMHVLQCSIIDTSYDVRKKLGLRIFVLVVGTVGDEPKGGSWEGCYISFPLGHIRLSVWRARNCS